MRREKITVRGNGPHIERWLLEELHTLDPRLELHWIAEDGNWVIKYRNKYDNHPLGIACWPADKMDRRLLITLQMWDTRQSETDKKTLLERMEERNAKVVAQARKDNWNRVDHSKFHYAMRAAANNLGSYPVNTGPIFVPQNLVTPIKKKPKSIVLPSKR